MPIRIGIVADSVNPLQEASVQVMSHLLGSRQTGFLRYILGHQRGLCYDVGVRYDRSSHFGHLRIDAKVPAAEVERSLENIFAAISSFAYKPITREDLLAAKLATKYHLYNAQIRSAIDVNEGLLRALEQRVDSTLALDKRLRHIDSVTRQTLQASIDKYLDLTRDHGKYVLLIRTPLYTQP